VSVVAGGHRSVIGGGRSAGLTAHPSRWPIIAGVTRRAAASRHRHHGAGAVRRLGATPPATVGSERRSASADVADKRRLESEFVRE